MRFFHTYDTALKIFTVQFYTLQNCLTLCLRAQGFFSNEALELFNTNLYMFYEEGFSSEEKVFILFLTLYALHMYFKIVDLTGTSFLVNHQLMDQRIYIL